MYNNEHLDYDEVEPENSDNDSTQSNNDYDEAEAVNETVFIAQATAEINVREDEKVQIYERNKMNQNRHTFQEDFYCVNHNGYKKDMKNIQLNSRSHSLQNSETNLESIVKQENEIVVLSENPYYETSERMNTEGSVRGSLQSTGTFVRCDSGDSLHLTVPNADTFQMVCTTENPYYGDVIITPPGTDIITIVTEIDIRIYAFID